MAFFWKNGTMDLSPWTSHQIFFCFILFCRLQTVYYSLLHTVMDLRRVKFLETEENKILYIGATVKR